MPFASDQLRLLWAVGLFFLPIVAGYRIARKLQSPPGAIGDAILLGYLVQYICAGLAGILGILSAVPLTVLALLMCGVLWISARWIKPECEALPISQADRRLMLGTFLGVAGFIAAMIYSQRMQPPLATDALTYHLPAAILWLQKKRIVLFQTWFFNPANTYSPLAGSLLATWLLAPIGNDALARFMQAGPLVLIFFAAMDLCRGQGVGTLAAALTALMMVLSRPFVTECILAKDDLFLSAFFLVAVVALSPRRINQSLGPARFGIALGLMLATKYTAILALPMLLLAADAPFRAGWRPRRSGAAAAIVLLIAGPWYLRNLILTRNPLFPIKLDFPGIHLPGLIASVHCQALDSIGGLWRVMTGGYFSMPVILFIFLWIAWLAMIARSGRKILIDPRYRLIALGPPVGIITFALFSPQAEVRFLIPAFGLMFLWCAIGAGRKHAVAVASIVALLAVATSFSTENAGQIARFAMWGITVALAGSVIRWLEADVFRWRRPIISFSAAAAVLFLICLSWGKFIDDYRNTRLGIWQTVYPTQGALWNFVNQQLPDGATIAYSNQFMIYPLYGFDCRRKVIYAPVRGGASIDGLIFPERISDTQILETAAEAANVPADRSAWRENLRSAAADYLIVGRQAGAPEIAWADADPVHFARIFQNAEAIVYRISKNPGG